MISKAAAAAMAQILPLESGGPRCADQDNLHASFLRLRATRHRIPGCWCSGSGLLACEIGGGREYCER
jgi:hypothetical protein